MLRPSTLNTLIVTAIIALTLLASYVSANHAARPAAPKIEQTASLTTANALPDISLRDVGGHKIRLRDFKGNIILLNFWASWCTPCIAEFSQFMNLANRMPLNITIMAVSIDDDRGNVDRFLKNHAKGYKKIHNLKIFWDKDKKVSQDMFGTVRVPETIVITPDLIMKAKIAGQPALPWDSDIMVQRLKALNN